MASSGEPPAPKVSGEDSAPAKDALRGTVASVTPARASVGAQSLKRAAAPKHVEAKRPRSEPLSEGPQGAFAQLVSPPSPLAARVPVLAAFARVPSKALPASLDGSAVLLSALSLLNFEGCTLPAAWLPRAAGVALPNIEGTLPTPTGHPAAPAPPAPPTASVVAPPAAIHLPGSKHDLFSDSEDEATAAQPELQAAAPRPKPSLPASWRVPDERLEGVVARSSFLADLRLLLRVA